MAKRDRLGGRLGKNDKPASVLREDHHVARALAFNTVIDALQGLNKPERTNTLAAVAEFFALSLTVEN